MTVYYSDNVVTPRGIISAYVIVEDNKIKEVVKEYSGDYIDYSDKVILPGFIDVHVHGWGRGSYSIENTPESIIKMGEDQAREGVTGFLATTLNASLEDTYQYIKTANEVYNTHIEGSKLLGVHLEGPFLSVKHKGMQKEEFCLDPNMEIMQKFYDLQEDKSMIKLMTMAPELPGAKEVIQFCHANGIQISIGHSGATFAEISELKEFGLGGVTHMFSGMSGLHHRELGVAGSALYYEDLMCEFAKQTGITVRHEAFDITYRIKGADGIFMTTDCIGSARRKEPSYQYTRGINYIPNGDTLIMKYDSGKVEEVDLSNYESIRTIEMSYIDSIREMLKHTPMTYLEVAKITSTNPAKYIGLDASKGRIQAGYDADLTIVDNDMKLVETVVEGKRVFVS